MVHMLEAIPDTAQGIGAHADGFAHWIANESAGHTVNLGDVNGPGHIVVAYDVTAADIREYVRESGDAYVSDAVRSGIVPGHYAVVTDSQGFVYGYRMTHAEAVATVARAEAIDAEFEG